MTASHWILLRMRNFSDRSCRENQNTRCTFNNVFPKKSCRLWDTVEKCCRAGQAADDVIRPMHFAYWTTKTTDIHSEYVILTAFPRQQWFRGLASMLRCTYVACIVHSYFEIRPSKLVVMLMNTSVMAVCSPTETALLCRLNVSCRCVQNCSPDTLKGFWLGNFSNMPTRKQKAKKATKSVKLSLCTP